ncbi:MAG: hypothetical protein AB7F39_06760 [Variibacter sp.]
MTIRQAPEATKLKTVLEVEDAIEKHFGEGAFRRLMGKARKRQHLSNYRSLNRFPSRTYLIVTTALAQIPASAPPKLWGIDEPPKRVFA